MNPNIDTLKEFYDELAAILEFETGIPREKAEALAKAEMETYAKHLQDKGAQ